MESQATLGFGTLFQRGNNDGPPETFTTIAEVGPITPPQSEADDVEVTHMESPDRAREFIQGLTNRGEASFTINWLPNHPTHDEVTGLMADKKSGVIRNWRIVLPNGLLTWTFRGYVKQFNPEIPIDDKLSAAVTIKVTGSESFS